MVGAGIVIMGAQVDDQGDPPTIEVVSAMIATGTGNRFETGSFLAPLERFYASIRDTSVALSTRLGWSNVE